MAAQDKKDSAASQVVVEIWMDDLGSSVWITASGTVLKPISNVNRRDQYIEALKAKGYALASKLVKG